ncbi:MAG: hypothetical protein V4515_07525 [Chloroflexota bacterium]
MGLSAIGAVVDLQVWDDKYAEIGKWSIPNLARGPAEGNVTFGCRIPHAIKDDAVAERLLESHQIRERDSGST